MGLRVPRSQCPSDLAPFDRFAQETYQEKGKAERPDHTRITKAGEPRWPSTVYCVRGFSH